MNADHIAVFSVEIDAPVFKVWDALVDPATIRRYMLGAQVESDWKEGDSITWKGEWEGKAYEDKGTILKIEPYWILQYSHYSPLSGKPDTPDSYHNVLFELVENEGKTQLSVSQDHNQSEREMEYSQKMWEMMMQNLKELIENPPETTQGGEDAERR